MNFSDLRLQTKLDHFLIYYIKVSNLTSRIQILNCVLTELTAVTEIQTTHSLVFETLL